MDTGGEGTMKMGFCMTFMAGLLLIGYLSPVFMQPKNNGKIAFVSSRDGTVQIYVMNGDGSCQKRISSSNCVCFFPEWSPDGEKIAFTLDCGILAVYIMDADGSNCRNLTTPLFDSAIPLDCGWPAWSPDGKKIAFVVGRYICVIDADGGTIHHYMVASFTWAPSWSPDGKKIAFALGEPGLESIYIMDADGSTVRKTASCGDNPSWSFNGKKIAFDSDKDGNKDIYIMDADGSTVKRLTDDPSDDWDPCWSPDGSKIAFVSNRDGNSEIYVMNADGTNQVNLTNNPADDRDPDWCCQTLRQSERPSQPEGTQILPFLERPSLQWGLIFCISLMVIIIIFLGRRIILRKKED